MTESHRIIRRVSLALHSAVSWQEELLKFISSLHSASLKNNPHYPRCVRNKQPGLGFSDLKYKTLNNELHDDKEKHLKALPQTLPRSCCQGGKKSAFRFSLHFCRSLHHPTRKRRPFDKLQVSHFGIAHAQDIHASWSTSAPCLTGKRACALLLNGRFGKESSTHLCPVFYLYFVAAYFIFHVSKTFQHLIWYYMLNDRNNGKNSSPQDGVRGAWGPEPQCAVESFHKVLFHPVTFKNTTTQYSSFCAWIWKGIWMRMSAV